MFASHAVGHRGETGTMKQELIEALVVLDTRQNSWLLNGGYQESIEGPRDRRQGHAREHGGFARGDNPM